MFKLEPWQAKSIGSLFWNNTKGAELVFMDDNAHPHRRNIVSECLQSEDIICTDWSAFSAVLSPVENVWDILG
ncbi:hypothetical protein TNCV_1210971 [Trichonephila clavipes]|nr:hypothetical protein TNCV_1210971 [Trichonephila clavipes]